MLLPHTHAPQETREKFENRLGCHWDGLGETSIGPGLGSVCPLVPTLFPILSYVEYRD
jgi:hypothetical protein